MIVALPEDALRPPLPAMPEWFPKAIENIQRRGDKPMFRIVDGLREKKFRNGKTDIKHLLQSDGTPCYFPVVKTRWRRQNTTTGEFKVYTNRLGAENDPDPDLSPDIEEASICKRVAIGRACWIVEVYIAPEEIDYDSWQKERFKFLPKSGIEQRIDVLGPYPRDGYYMACFDVVDAEGNPVSPSERTLDECKRRIKAAESNTQTVDQAIQGSHSAIEAFEKKQVAQMTDNFFQWSGVTWKTQTGLAAMSKPLASAARR